MKRKSNVRDLVIYGILIIPMLMCLIDSTYKLVDIKYKWGIFLLIAILTLVYLSISSLFRFAWLSIFLTLLLPKPLLLVKKVLYLFKGIPAFIEGIVENQYVAMEYVDYLNGYMIILTIVFAFIFYFLIAVKKHTLPILIVGYGLISFYYFWGIENIYTDAQIYLIFGLILYGYNNFSRKWEAYKNKKVNIEKGYYGKLIASTIIIVLIAGFLSNIMPNNRKPLDVMHIEGNLFDYDEIDNSNDSNQGKGSRFSISSTGYQKIPERLGGPVKLDNSTALEIKGDSIYSGMHLRGTVKDYYNGYLWDKTSQSKEIIKNDNPTGIYDVDYDEKKFEIINKKLKTCTIFNVLYPYKIINNRGDIFIDSDMEIYSQKIIKKGKGYSVISKEHRLDSQTILEITPNEINKPSRDVMRYLQISHSVPERVYDLTHSITDKYSSPYEKASAIESYLKKNYKYNLNASQVPIDRDFVDYFLFDEKEGYCTYYASALAVMSRIAGVPSRYVEGYLVPSVGLGNSKVDIKNSDAHAWVEIYLDNAGWITFDPTPGNDSMALNMDAPYVNNGDIGNGGSPRNEDPDNTSGNPEIDNRIKDEDTTDTTPDYEEGGKFLTWSSIKIVLYIILFILLVLIAIYMLQYRIIKKKGNVIVFFVYKLMFYGRIIGCPYNKGETVREYIKRLEIPLEMDMTSLADICEENIYGKKVLEKEQTNSLFDTIKSLKIKYRNIKFYLKDFINFLEFYLKNIAFRKNMN